jgi:hypothetical protein
VFPVTKLPGFCLCIYKPLHFNSLLERWSGLSDCPVQVQDSRCVKCPNFGECDADRIHSGNPGWQGVPEVSSFLGFGGFGGALSQKTFLMKMFSGRYYRG